MIAKAKTRFPVADLHFKVDGPVVADLQRVFLEDWYFATGVLLDNEGSFLRSGIGNVPRPRHCRWPGQEFRKLHWIIMGALACADRRIRIMTPYFIPDRALISAMARQPCGE